MAAHRIAFRYGGAGYMRHVPMRGAGDLQVTSGSKASFMTDRLHAPLQVSCCRRGCPPHRDLHLLVHRVLQILQACSAECTAAPSPHG